MTPTVVLDCRWLSFTGAGRVVELLLKGFRDAPPTGHWQLWGPDSVALFSWPGAPVVKNDTRPNTWHGQRDWLRVPSADLVVFMHQQRPLRPVPALTTILDTTPIQFPASRAERFVKTQFLRRAAAMSRGILTISEFARRGIVDELGVAEEKVEILRLPADADLAERVLSRRADSGGQRRDVALYLGLFLRHKNLPRLIEAFGRSCFCTDGGRLMLVGGKELAEPLRASLDDRPRRFVDLRARCTQIEIEELLATSRFLIQPSLVEGFGLPVWEALASGLPVCASDGGALPEITMGLAEHFPATSVDAMAAAIDACAARAARMQPGDDVALSQRLISQAPSVGDFARQFEAIVQRHLSELATGRLSYAR
ncbi:MAG TPA: glycosyltransferase [Acidimicrobiales bacterium]|nr:glycosyltransferase [Acidimicrobiales bacterium]